jgi:hypothetical protein
MRKISMNKILVKSLVMMLLGMCAETTWGMLRRDPFRRAESAQTKIDDTPPRIDGKIWKGTSGCLYKFNGKMQSWLRANSTNPDQDDCLWHPVKGPLPERVIAYDPMNSDHNSSRKSQPFSSFSSSGSSCPPPPAHALDASNALKDRYAPQLRRLSAEWNNADFSSLKFKEDLYGDVVSDEFTEGDSPTYRLYVAIDLTGKAEVVKQVFSSNSGDRWTNCVAPSQKSPWPPPPAHAPKPSVARRGTQSADDTFKEQDALQRLQDYGLGVSLDEIRLIRSNAPAPESIFLSSGDFCVNWIAGWIQQRDKMGIWRFVRPGDLSSDAVKELSAFFAANNASASQATLQGSGISPSSFTPRSSFSSSSSSSASSLSSAEEVITPEERHTIHLFKNVFDIEVHVSRIRQAGNWGVKAVSCGYRTFSFDYTLGTISEMINGKWIECYCDHLSDKTKRELSAVLCRPVSAPREAARNSQSSFTSSSPSSSSNSFSSGNSSSTRVEAEALHNQYATQLALTGTPFGSPSTTTEIGGDNSGNDAEEVTDLVYYNAETREYFLFDRNGQAHFSINPRENWQLYNRLLPNRVELIDIPAARHYENQQRLKGESEAKGARAAQSEEDVGKTAQKDLKPVYQRITRVDNFNYFQQNVGGKLTEFRCERGNYDNIQVEGEQGGWVKTETVGRDNNPYILHNIKITRTAVGLATLCGVAKVVAPKLLEKLGLQK